MFSFSLPSALPYKVGSQHKSCTKSKFAKLGHSILGILIKTLTSDMENLE
jgi:hypothetical protein